jgi:hypothetical protein
MNNEDDRIIVNLSVWEDVVSLHEDVYESGHHGVLRDRKRWFQKFDGPYYALWCVPVGEYASTEEGKERLDFCESMEIRRMLFQLDIFSRSLQGKGVGERIDDVC